MKYDFHLFKENNKIPFFKSNGINKGFIRKCWIEKHILGIWYFMYLCIVECDFEEIILIEFNIIGHSKEIYYFLMLLPFFTLFILGRIKTRLFNRHFLAFTKCRYLVNSHEIPPFNIYVMDCKTLLGIIKLYILNYTWYFL